MEGSGAERKKTEKMKGGYLEGMKQTLLKAVYGLLSWLGFGGWSSSSKTQDDYKPSDAVEGEEIVLKTEEIHVESREIRSRSGGIVKNTHLRSNNNMDGGAGGSHH